MVSSSSDHTQLWPLDSCPSSKLLALILILPQCPCPASAPCFFLTTAREDFLHRSPIKNPPPLPLGILTQRSMINEEKDQRCRTPGKTRYLLITTSSISTFKMGGKGTGWEERCVSLPFSSLLICHLLFLTFPSPSWDLINEASANAGCHPDPAAG